MAQELVVNFVLNGVDEANQSLEQLGQSVEQVNTDLQQTSNIPAYNQVSDNADKASKSVDNFEKKLAKSVDVGQKAEGVAKTLSGSINLATSSFALFGGAGEELQKTLVRVQAAASFANGIKDLTEGFNKLGGASKILGTAMKGIPLILIASLVITLIEAFGGFDAIIKIVTQALSFALAPFNALISAFSSAKPSIDDVTSSLEKYDKQLADLNARYSEEERAIRNSIALLKARGASATDIAKEEDKLLNARINNQATLIAEAKNQINTFLDNQLIIQQSTDEQINRAINEQIRKRSEAFTDEKERTDAENKLRATADKLLNNLAQARINRSQSITDKELAELERQNEANRKAADAAKAAEERRKKAVDDRIAALRKQLEAEELAIRQAAELEIDGLKQQLLNREITEEQFNQRKIAKDIETNNKIAENLKLFQITEQTQKQIGADNVLAIIAERDKKILDAQRKATDIQIAEQKKLDDKLRKAREEEDAKFLAKQQADDKERQEQQLSAEEFFLLTEQLDLRRKYNMQDEEEVKMYNRKLKELQLQQNQERLLTLELGTSEYFKLASQIKQQEIALEEETAEEIAKLEEKRRQQLIDKTKELVENIASIVQDVSPLFESVGQTALQSFENIASGADELLTTLTDKELDLQGKLAAGFGFAANAIGELTNIVNKSTEERIAKIDAEEQARIASLQRQKEAGIITEEQLESGVTAIQVEAQKKRREEQKKAFAAEKAIRITQAVLQTAQAVLAAFSSGVATPLIGPAVGPIFAGIAAAFGAAQIALIASQKFPEQGGGGASAPSVPSVSTPSAATGAITPTQFNPNLFGTNANQEQTFGQSANTTTGGNVLRAYVVESDIASTSDRLNTIRTTSEL
jgi:hypothetical protein